MLVFISHSRENSSIALRLCEELRHRGVQTWLDTRDFEPGSSWEEEISRAVRRSDAFVFVIGPPGQTDRWQRFEWDQILDLEYDTDASRRLIPVVVGGAEAPGFLRIRQIIEVEGSPVDYAAVADRLVQVLESGKTIDPVRVKHVQAARDESLQRLRQYSEMLNEHERRRTELRGLE